MYRRREARRTEGAKNMMSEKLVGNSVVVQLVFPSLVLE